MIVHPGVKATMIQASGVEIGASKARTLDHEYNGSGMHEWVKVRAGCMREVTVRAEFDAIPDLHGTAVLTFRDVVHGKLGPYKVRCDGN